MKKLLTILFFLSGTYVFAQYYPQQAQAVPPQPAAKPQQQSGPAIRRTLIRPMHLTTTMLIHIIQKLHILKALLREVFNGGGGLEYMPAPTIGVEFTYLRLDSKAIMDYYDVVLRTDVPIDISHNYLFLSFNKYMPVNPKVEPFGGMQLGMGIYRMGGILQNDNESSATKFCWGIKAGANIWASEKVGIKLQAGLISAVQAVGGSVYFGTGGAGAGVSGFSTYWQFSLGGGLVFRLR